MSEKRDIIIVGGGIVGLTLARELALRKLGRIAVLEKEPDLGRHASGRNSGVVHAGIYYPPSSLKAQFCVRGHKLLLEYVDANKLPVLKCGKVIVATKPETVPTLATLFDRATQVGALIEKISLAELKELEPMAHSHDHALWSPRTAVIDSKAVLKSLAQDLQSLGVEIHYGVEITGANPENATLHAAGKTWSYGFLFNTAGVHADRVAHWFGVGLDYRILPFKGLYWRSTDEFEKKIKRLIYPAPDVNMPFLGVHVTLTVDGHVLFGPTAIPAFGRENYSLMGGLDPLETPVIGWHLAKMLVKNPAGFRSYVRQEMGRYRARNFFNEARALIPELRQEDIGEFYKVGIRAQLMNLKKGALEMDFVLEKGPRSLHVLNAISPAFTSAFAFAPHLADQLGKFDSSSATAPMM